MAVSSVVITDEFEMEYCRFGSGKRVFVILPGLSIQSVMGMKDSIEEAYSIFKDDFTTYVFDRRKNIPEDYSIYDMADDTAAAIEKMGLRDVFIFGASQGGMIAMAMAIRYPQLVKKAVLGSTSPHVKPEQEAVVKKWIALAEKGDREGLYLEYGKEIYPPDVYEKYRDVFLQTAQTVTDEELKKFVILAKSIPGFDVSQQLDKIQCPIMALGVFEDRVLDSDATMEIAENLDSKPDFALYMYTGYGHAAFDTAPGYKEKVYDFLMKAVV